MAKYRKKPIVIDAWQWDGTNTDELLKLNKSIYFCEGPNDLQELEIKTLEGTMTASKGDWIIRGVKGEFYPCKPDIFTATYEPA